MGKKEESTAGTTAVAIPSKYDAIVRTLSAEEKTDLMAMDEEARLQYLETLESIAASAELAKDVVFTDIKPANENMAILTAGGPGLRAGATLVGFLLGTRNVFSKTPKENWKEIESDGQKYWHNSFFLFADKNGREFGVWSSPTLRVLEKVMTAAATPSKIAKNPLVAIKYVGLIEGKEILKQQYGIELQKGNKCHVFTTNIEKGAVHDQYHKGCVNFLNAPFPQTSGKEEVSRDEANRRNYERLMALQGGSSVAGVLDAPSVQ